MASSSQQIDVLGVEKIWKTTRGAGVRVAVLDTGVVPSDGLPASRVQAVGLDGGGAAPTADMHGTFCGSLIGSEERDAEGVAPEAKLLSIQITTASDSLAAADVVRGLRLALSLGCDVISCSFTLNRLGNSGADLADVVRQAHLSGIPVLTAHGNVAGEAAPFPEEIQHAIAISSHTRSGRPQQVNFNQWTDAFCLGDQLTVLNAAGMTRTWAGKTSGATALVAGVVALALGAIPKSKRLKAGMAVEGLIKATATNGGSQPDGSPVLLVNAKRLVDAVIDL